MTVPAAPTGAGPAQVNKPRSTTAGQPDLIRWPDHVDGIDGLVALSRDNDGVTITAGTALED